MSGLAYVDAGSGLLLGGLVYFEAGSNIFWGVLGCFFGSRLVPYFGQSLLSFLFLGIVFRFIPCSFCTHLGSNLFERLAYFSYFLGFVQKWRTP